MAENKELDQSFDAALEEFKATLMATPNLNPRDPEYDRDSAAQALSDVAEKLFEIMSMRPIGKETADNKSETEQPVDPAALISIYSLYLKGDLPIIGFICEIMQSNPEKYKIGDLAAILTSSFTSTGERIEGSKYKYLIDNAAERLSVESQHYKSPDKILYPLDKVNKKLFNPTTWFEFAAANADENTEGEEVTESGDTYTLNVKTGKYGTGDIVIPVIIDFEKLSEDKAISLNCNLNPFDFSCLNAVNALYECSGKYMTVSHIFHAMGNEGRPAKKQIAKINASLNKMRTTTVIIDNEEESKVYNYPHFKYDDTLLQFSRIEFNPPVNVNNVPCDNLIYIKDKPPLAKFAEGRNQITTISPSLLNPPINKTDNIISIIQYLISNIAAIKSGHLNSKMTYKTIFENLNISDKKSRQRAFEYIKTILDYYKEKSFIKSYSESTDSNGKIDGIIIMV